MKFREFIKDIDDFYNNELLYIENRILIAESSKKGSLIYHNIKPIYEAVIEPHNIKIDTNNIDKLNIKYKTFNIIFEYSANEIKAYYDKKLDIIYIIFIKNTDFNIIEALIGHEMVHREQHKRAGANYFKQSEDYVSTINSLSKKLNLLNMNNPEEAKEYIKTYKKYNELLDIFLYLTPYESMAYAYQFVKEYKHLTPSKIIEKLKEDKIKINNLTKKYIAMYWLIRNKI